MATKKRGSTNKELTSARNIVGKYKEAKKLKDELLSVLDELKNSRDESNDILAGIRTVQQESQTSNTAIKSAADEVSTTKDSVSQAKAQVDQEKDEILAQKTRINEEISKLDAAENKFQELLKTVEEVKVETGKQLAVVTGGTLAESFHERQQQLRKVSLIWLAVLAVATVGAVIIGWFIIDMVLKSGTSDIIKSLLRLAVTIPIFFAIFFSSSSFRRERELEEEYAFKSSVARSLAAYQKLLRDELPEGSNEQIMQFITNSINNIYSSPTERTKSITKKERGAMEAALAFIKEINKLKS
jgi:uncharacterized phage infection (PIP) family protein YhgE